MFDIFIFISVISFWTAVIGGALTLFGLRIYIAVRAKLELKTMLFVIGIPCSIGYYLTFTEQSPMKTLYQRLVIFFFVLTVIGSLLPLYMHLGLNLI
jgi:hypothetical protein